MRSEAEAGGAPASYDKIRATEPPKNQQFLVCEGKLRSSYGTTACTGVEYALSCPAELDRATFDPQIIGDHLHSRTISLIHMASER